MKAFDNFDADFTILFIFIYTYIYIHIYRFTPEIESWWNGVFCGIIIFQEEPPNSALITELSILESHLLDLREWSTLSKSSHHQLQYYLPENNNLVYLFQL